MNLNADKSNEIKLNGSFDESKLLKFIKDIGRSLAGVEMDYTKGNLHRAIMLLSIPMVLEMLMESIFAIVDIYFVTKLGAEAVATVGITESVLTIVYSLAFALSSAATAIVSRRIGEKNPEAASNAAFQAILAGIALSLPISVAGWFFAGDILALMGANPVLIEKYSSYTQIMLGGNVTITLLFIINGVIRSSGDAAISLRVLALGNFLNIVLDPLLIFGYGPFPEMGIAGAAIATNIGRGIAVLFQFYILFSGKYRVKLIPGSLKPDFKVISQMFKLSMGSAAQNMIPNSSYIFLVRILTDFGSFVVAGYTLGIRILFFTLLPSIGLSNAASALVGQNLGAKQPERAEKSVWVTARYNMVFLGIIGLMFILIPEFWVGLLARDPIIIKYGAECLRAISYGFISYGFGIVMINSFNGAGDTLTPMKVCIIAFWLIEIPLAWILSMPLEIGQMGVYYSIVIAETCFTIIAVTLFRRGKWKEIKV